MHLFVASVAAAWSSPQFSGADPVEPPLPHQLAIPRHLFNLTAFGARPGGAFNNARAFEAGVEAVKGAGGGELYVPSGIWLTTGFALTSHMSLFLERGAVVRGALPNHTDWRARNESCASYGAKIECRGGHVTSGPGGQDERHSGYEPIVGGWNLTDVHITGNNGTIDGQGDWWWFAVHGHGPCVRTNPHRPAWCDLKHGRPHALLFSRCERVVVSGITITSSPFWTLRFWASQQLRASNLTITATRSSMNNDGVDVDSSRDAVIENLYYDGGDDGVAMKSGMCAAGTAFATPTRNVRVENVVARTRSSCFVTGSEDQGGVHNVSVRNFTCRDSPGGIILKDTCPPAFGGCGKGLPKSNFSFDDVKLHNISGFWPIAPGGKAVAGKGIAIQGVDGFRIQNVIGDGFVGDDDAGEIQWAKNIVLGPNISIDSKHGYSCHSHVGRITVVGSVVPGAPSASKCGKRPAAAAKSLPRTAAAGHSCYYYVNFDPAGPRCGGAKGNSAAKVAKCIACGTVAAPKEPPSYVHCTTKLIADACRGILPGPPPPGPPPPPDAGQMTLTLLHEAAASKGAVCLDGSPGGYYWREGKGADRDKFLLVFNGGGWCVGNSTANGKLNCASRATGKLGSSKGWSKSLHEDAHGMTNSNCTVNPAFCSWSVAYMYYCDGVSFSGDNANPVPVPGGKVSPIFFRGKRLLDANLASLLQTRGLRSATAVVLSGHSAGGLATYLHADYVRSQLPASLGFYAAVPDAGFFLDHARFGAPNAGEKYFGQGMRITWALANASGSFNSKCVAAHRAAPSDCIFPQNFAQHISTPLHVTQSQYDAWQLPNVLGLGCTPPKGDCNASQLQAFQQYRVATMSALNASGLYKSRPGFGMFNDACITHTQGYYGDYMDNKKWEVPAGSGVTLAQSLKAWLDSGSGGGANKNVHVDRVPWPENKPCHQY